MQFMDVSKYIEGANLKVKTKNGETVKRIYFNNSATPLVLKNVVDNLNCEIPWLTYINAPGIISEKNTLKYENVRSTILKLIDGDEEKDSVIYVQKLLGISPKEAYVRFIRENPVGLVRISLGMYNTFDEVDSFIHAIKTLAFK
ncbi:pyridoxal phosphate-dependent transferase [Clostridioides difficile]|uniref:pyridoxal phosphate-dependent transferase n=2 Tax=Clostridioides difficile TaxID=1496 RepID=UPI00038D3D3B|nr:pyridoxal phosphate-dependent transferase [Clostridioides difficile]EQK02274.1 putative pyridoxal phosphate-dependent transferase [Clostridioides difficile P59]MCH7236706.1 hypothetical protein [Clostridioides difficile]MCI4281730.1 hypothetical protein [Clostridioides difficile]MCI4303809.1 hypothetical protein [Clostridioides difficile]MCI4719710.1 hypothetical protein [Clostridioides difficile]